MQSLLSAITQLNCPAVTIMQLTATKECGLVKQHRNLVWKVDLWRRTHLRYSVIIGGPDNADKLNPRDNEARRPGTDFTWSCPKSVSLAAIVLKDKRIFEAFQNSVREAMSYI